MTKYHYAIYQTSELNLKSFELEEIFLLLLKTSFRAVIYIYIYDTNHVDSFATKYAQKTRDYSRLENLSRPSYTYGNITNYELKSSQLQHFLEDEIDKLIH